MAAKDDEDRAGAGSAGGGAAPARPARLAGDTRRDETPAPADHTVVDRAPGEQDQAALVAEDGWGLEDLAAEPGLDPSVVAAVLGGEPGEAPLPEPSRLSRVSIDALGDAFPEPTPDDEAPPAAAAPPAASTRTVTVAVDGRVDPEPFAEVSRVESLGPAFPDDDLVPAGPGRGVSPAAPRDLAALAGAIGSTARQDEGGTGAGQHTASVVRPNAIDEAWATIDDQGSSWGRLDERTTGHRRVAAPRRAEPVVAARLVALEGGAEHALAADLVVGRARASGLVVDDPSVSREHAHLVREGERWLVVDRKSGNGTFVNGERVSRRALASGDVVSFGQVRFTFVEAGAATPAVERRPRERPRPVAPEPPAPAASAGTSFHLLVALAIVLVSAAVATSIWIWRHRAPARSGVTSYFAAGATAFEQRDWAGAQAQFDRVLALEPGSEAARRFLERIEREKAFARQLASARAALGRGELLRAYTEAAAVTTDSTYAADAREVTRAVDAELERRVSRARAALDAGSPREAAELLATVDAIRPGRPDVGPLLERARRADVRQSTARDGHDERARDDGSPAAKAVDDAVRLFAVGKVEEALARIDATGPAGREVAQRMHRFEEMWADALAEHRAKRADSALPLLEKARDLEAQVTGTQPGALRGEVRKKLADMYYVRANDALMAERFVSGLEALEAALAANPGHMPSRRRLDDLTARAGELLDEADELRHAEPERAKARYRAMLRLLPPADERARRARRHLDATP